ncbi:MAG: MFS transporter [Anaerolineales bacterium]|nr:MFS transporter [Anaerolineales bacterium]
MSDPAAEPPFPGPTTAEKIRLLPWALFATATNTVFGQFTVFGSVFVLYLSQLGLSNTFIGFLLSLFPFFGLTALFTSAWVARFGYKRTYLTFWSLRKFITAGLLLTPLVLARLGGGAASAWVALCVGGFAICRAIGETGSYPWSQEYIPAGVRGKFAASDNTIGTLASLVSVALAGFVLDRTPGQTGFMALIAVGVVFGLLSVWGTGHLPGGARLAAAEAKQQASLGKLGEALRDRDFVLYLIAASLVTIAWGPLGSFLPLFMEQQAGLTTSQAVWLQTGGLLGGLAAGYVWGWAADRYGGKPVILSGLLLIALTPLAWMLMPRFSPWSPYAALAISLVRGALGLGWGIGSTRLLFVNLVPPEKKTSYMAVNYAWMGAVGGLSTLLGGRLLDLTAGVHGQFWIFTIDPYTLLFVIGLLLPAIAVVLIQAIRTDSRFGVSEFAGMFFHGNPLMAAESLIRYGRARDERAVVSVTERLGQAKSRLIVEELLEALADPRFNVRFEAVLALARMPADARVLAALTEILAGEEPAMSVIAAWALGRVGDPRALPALQAALDAPYRSVQAHSARALGTLEDTASAAHLLERFQTQTDHGLRMAYASALGKLRVTAAVGPLLDFLRTRHDPSARRELALGLARLLGDEQYFIALWRATHGETGTGLAQAVSALLRPLQRAHVLPAAENDWRPQWTACADAFARGQLDEGAAQLRALLEQMPLDAFTLAGQAVLREVAARLAECGAVRLEYLLLALHALHEARQPPGLPVSAPPTIGA